MTCLDSQSHGGQGLRCTFPGTGGVINPQQCDGGRDLRDAQSGSRRCAAPVPNCHPPPPPACLPWGLKVPVHLAEEGNSATW